MRRLPAEGEWFKNVEENLENANVTLPRPLVWALTILEKAIHMT